MDIIGAIFNISGAMLRDRKYHSDAWRLCIEDLTMREISNKDVREFVEGKESREILEHFLGNELTEAMILQFQEEKDRIYRNLIIEEHPELIPGLTGFLDYLSKASVPMAIVTTQPVINMNMLFDEYELYKWFDWSHIIMISDGIIRRPHPDLYRQAAKLLQVDPRHCLAFSADPTDIRAAHYSGISNIVYVAEEKKGYIPEELPDVIRQIFSYRKEHWSA